MGVFQYLGSYYRKKSTSLCRKYKPYGADEQAADTAPASAAKATPVTDFQPKMQYEKPQIIEEPTPFSFDDFDSELEGLL